METPVSGVHGDDNGLDIDKIPLADNGSGKGKICINANVSSMTPRKSSVTTLEPSLFTFGTSGVPRRKSSYSRNGNSDINDFNRIEILPGVYECNSNEKYLTIGLDSYRKIEELIFHYQCVCSCVCI